MANKYNGNNDYYNDNSNKHDNGVVQKMFERFIQFLFHIHPERCSYKQTQNGPQKQQFALIKRIGCHYVERAGKPLPIHERYPATAPHGDFCLLRFRPGPVRPSLDDLDIDLPIKQPYRCRA